MDKVVSSLFNYHSVKLLAMHHPPHVHVVLGDVSVVCVKAYVVMYWSPLLEEFPLSHWLIQCLTSGKDPGFSQGQSSKLLSVKVHMTQHLFERAFKMMKNGVSFIVIALLVAELFKILIYAN